MADIEKMFHQVKVAPQDIDFLRFWWWPDGNIIQDMREYRMTVHLFSEASSSSCASYALKRVAEDNKDSYPAEVIDSVHRNFYLLKSVDTESHAIALYKELTDVCARGGFRVLKWISNSKVVLNSISEIERAKEMKNLDLDIDGLPIERTLGFNGVLEKIPSSFKCLLKHSHARREEFSQWSAQCTTHLDFLLHLPYQQSTSCRNYASMILDGTRKFQKRVQKYGDDGCWDLKE